MGSASTKKQNWGVRHHLVSKRVKVLRGYGKAMGKHGKTSWDYLQWIFHTSSLREGIFHGAD